MKKQELQIETLREICQSKEFLENHDDWYAKFFGRRVSIYLTRLFISLRFSPNQVSLLSIFIGIIAGLMFIKNDLVLILASFLLFQFSFILDSSDGELSRYLNKHSNFGALLEDVSSSVISVVLYMALAITAWGITKNSLFLIIGSIGAIVDTFRDLVIMWFRKNPDTRANTVNSAFDLAESHIGSRKIILFSYRVYSYLKINKWYYPRERVIIFTVVSLIDFGLGIFLLKYLLCIFVILGVIILVATLLIVHTEDLPFIHNFINA